MKKIPLLAAAVAAFSLFAPASAVAAKADGPKMTKVKLIEKYDANKNGKLDGDEIALIKSDYLADLKGDLKKLDADHDGKLSDEELASLTGGKKAGADEKKVGGKRKKGV